MEPAILVVNATHVTKQYPKPNLRVPVLLTGRKEEIGGQQHVEILLSGEKHFVEGFYIQKNSL